MILKYLISILITIILFVALLFTATQNSKAGTKIVDVPYTHLNAKEKKEIDCLTDNIFYEAGYEPETGKIAVGLVTLNRVKSNVFEDSVCGVVKQKVKSTCQFTWFCEGKKAVSATQKELYNDVRQVALYVYFNYQVIDDVTKGAIYYHADYVSPGWSKLQKTTKIGRHIFYTDPKVITINDRKT
jgi:spore germination cell wall hydrolase CwlJ-like protein